MKATLVLAAIAGITAATPADPLVPRKAVDLGEAGEKKGKAVQCGLMPGGHPTVKDCHPVIQHFIDHKDEPLKNPPKPGKSGNIYCLGQCALQLLRAGDVELKNGDIAKAAGILIDGCGKGDDGKKTDGLVALGEGASAFRLATMPRLPESCTWD